MSDTTDDPMRANSKAFIYKLEAMEFAMEKATKGFLQDDKGSIFYLETRDTDVTRVLLARILRSLSKEAVKQNLDEIFTDFNDFASMSIQQNNDWANNFPNLLVCKIDRDEQLDEQSTLLKSWVNIVKDESKKIIFIGKNSKCLERTMMKMEMANFINLKFTDLWKENERSIINSDNGENVGGKHANMDEQDLVNYEPASERAVDKDKQTLHDKAKTRDAGSVKILPSISLKQLHTRDFAGNTTLHRAAERGETELVESLVYHGAKMGIKNTFGETPLHLAAATGYPEIVDILLTGGANVNATDNELKTPLHISCSNPVGNKARVILELLLESGAEINRKCAVGKTPLHVASRYGHIKLVKSLLQHGANIDAQNNYGQTPLHSATDYNHPEVVLYLLQKGANINIRNKHCRTVLEVARSRNDNNLIKILEEHSRSIKNPR